MIFHATQAAALVAASLCAVRGIWLSRRLAAEVRRSSGQGRDLAPAQRRWIAAAVALMGFSAIITALNGG